MQKIADVIKYEGDNSTFIWKHECEDFNSLTQLVVHESQEAIFFMNGQALDLFGPGRYTLETQNIPKIGKILNRMTGDETPFHCEVYFINKTEQMSIKWGTDSKVQYRDPEYKFLLSIGASGEMSLRAEDSRKLLIKLVGTEQALSQQKLVSFFRAFLMTKVKTYIAQVIKAKSINIFEIDENLIEFSYAIKNLLISDFLDYGIALEQFFVTNIAKPDGERQYEEFKEIHFRKYADIEKAKLRQEIGVIDAETEAKKVVIEAEAISEKRKKEGYTYAQERGFDVAQKAAENEGAGTFTSMGVGLGAMAGVSGTIAGVMGETMQVALDDRKERESNNILICENCGCGISHKSKFCSNCGNKIVPIVPVGMTLCLNCNKTVVKGKFCPECGSRIISVCPKCGTEIPNGAKFCYECGEKI